MILYISIGLNVVLALALWAATADSRRVETVGLQSNAGRIRYRQLIASGWKVWSTDGITVTLIKPRG